MSNLRLAICYYEKILELRIMAWDNYFFPVAYKVGKPTFRLRLPKWPDQDYNWLLQIGSLVYQAGQVFEKIRNLYIYDAKEH